MHSFLLQGAKMYTYWKLSTCCTVGSIYYTSRQPQQNLHWCQPNKPQSNSNDQKQYIYKIRSLSQKLPKHDQLDVDHTHTHTHTQRDSSQPQSTEQVSTHLYVPGQ